MCMRMQWVRMFVLKDKSAQQIRCSYQEQKYAKKPDKDKNK